MRNIVTIGFAAGLLAAALPAQAAVSTTNTMRSDAREQPQTGQSSDSNRRICVREQRTESRVVHPVCHTAREWMDIEGEVPGQH